MDLRNRVEWLNDWFENLDREEARQQHEEWLLNQESDEESDSTFETRMEIAVYESIGQQIDLHSCMYLSDAASSSNQSMWQDAASTGTTPVNSEASEEYLDEGPDECINMSSDTSSASSFNNSEEWLYEVEDLEMPELWSRILQAEELDLLVDSDRHREAVELRQLQDQEYLDFFYESV